MLGTPPQTPKARTSLLNETPSLLRRPSKSLHQENHVPAKQMDRRRQDLQAGRRDHQQRNRRAGRKMGIRRTSPTILASTHPPMTDKRGRCTYPTEPRRAGAPKRRWIKRTRPSSPSTQQPHPADDTNQTRSREEQEAPPVEKTEKQIQDEIQSIFRQITASVTFLPMLDGNCTFNVLVYADADSEVPLEWGDSDAKEIKNGEKVKLRSFSTSNHRVDTLVSYR